MFRRPLLICALAILAACGVTACGTASNGSGSSGSGSTPGASAPATAKAVIKRTTISGKAVLTNSEGFTLYWFGPDTATTSTCTGSCTTYWPPVPGPVTAGAGVTGKFGTITRGDGTIQATYDGHPLYTYTGDTAPGQANGNKLRLSGGVWYEVTVSAGTSGSGSGGSGW